MNWIDPKITPPKFGYTYLVIFKSVDRYTIPKNIVISIANVRVMVDRDEKERLFFGSLHRMNYLPGAVVSMFPDSSKPDNGYIDYQYTGVEKVVNYYPVEHALAYIEINNIDFPKNIDYLYDAYSSLP